MILVILFFLLGFVLITKGADIFINCIVEIGKRTRISEIVLGATIVSFATTLPEFTVSMLSSIDGYTTMSLGNAVGSIICNTTLILGLVSIISPFKVDRESFLSKTIILLISVFILFILSIDRKINFMNGVILLTMFGVYMYVNYTSVKKDSLNKRAKTIVNTSKKQWIRLVILFTIGISMMVIGSKLLVNNGVLIAEYIGIPQGIISLTVIALGTSLPELVSSLTAIRKNHHAISVGNVLGANTLNILSVIGASSLVNDIPILSQTMTIDFPIMLIALMILIMPTLKTQKLQRVQGILLLGVYLFYLGTLYSVYI